MHEVAEVDLVKIARSTVMFSRIDEIEIPDLADAKTDLLENHQDNGATPPFNTHPYPPHSPLEES